MQSDEILDFDSDVMAMGFGSGDDSSKTEIAFAISNRASRRRWIESTVNVTQYVVRRSGWMTAHIVYAGFTDGSDKTSWFVDEVLWTVCHRPDSVQTALDYAPILTDGSTRYTRGVLEQMHPRAIARFGSTNATDNR